MGVEQLHVIEEEEGLSNGSDILSMNMSTLGIDFQERTAGPKYGDVDENRMLEIMNRMNRVVMILKVC